MSTPLFLFLGDLGGGEIMLILVVILIFFGANKIPELARGLGKGIREFKDASSEIRSEIENAGLPKQNQPYQQPTAYTAPTYDTPVQQSTLEQSTITSVSSTEPIAETTLAPPMDGGIAPQPTPERSRLDQSAN
ncbi:twin-arginine translocation protein, TatA/E family subunit [Hymenobacter roseosalivarius DSM 11622]|uniref:Sec-independent protein translocase protein TatA n=1 Tax=Hymenobacter roseosalivarius DSM 11622 TaxID=645990 RepID=A0A1W1VR39_9BACT|nr:twin-arginine translocase TatA/TatE family subunit [Hymenobacter roseosalivarius]SMB95733.1 twin-arginine translocation protein, TatA/E family subunit [Hymenobacter roseosalivarius DSM 11622]